jgi:hypothetical protein
MRLWNAVPISLLLVLASPARGKELEVRGRATVSAAGDPLAVRAAGEREARRRAIVIAIEKILGPDAARDPRVANKVEAIDEQVPDDRVVDKKTARVGDAFEVTVTLVLDDKEFRALMSNAGIAAGGSTARSYAILAVIDEFLTTATDLKAPLEELEEYSREKGGQRSQRSASSTASASSSADSAAGATVVGGRRSSGSAEVVVAGMHAAKAASRSSSSSASTESARLDEENHDDIRYKRLIRYQPRNVAPEKVSQTYAAFVGQLQDYDLRVLDNELFRAQFLKDKPLTLEQLQASGELARYVAAAKAEANADFFMVGTAIIVDAGRNVNTGETECTGVVTVRTYSTTTGESVASETFSEASCGRNVDECSGNLARKLGSVGGPVLGAKLHEYWKRRSTYGRELTLTLKGKSLPLMVRAAFGRAVKAVPGVEHDVQRACGDTLCQVVVTYKGSEPIEQALANALSANTAFAALDARTDGPNVLLCMGPCTAFDGPAQAPATTTGDRP